MCCKLSGMVLTTVVVCSAVVAQADVFNMGSGLTSLETVPVGNPGNAGELSGGNDYGPARICGAVGYTYNIGKYEVTAGQYTVFLNAKAKTDPYGLYNADMYSPTGCNIQRFDTSDGYFYTVTEDYANRPVNYVSFWDAARFTNWLCNGQGNGDTETGAYTLNSYNGSDGRTIARDLGAKWVLPSEDEWYKAAYHKNDGVTGNYWDYPTGTNIPLTPGRDMSDVSGNNANYFDAPSPIDSGTYYTTVVGEFQNSASPYGTFDQGGNVFEWNEDLFSSTSRVNRGGSFMFGSEWLLASYGRSGIDPSSDYLNIGFRVASVPEPGSFIMLLVGAIGLLASAWRRRGR